MIAPDVYARLLDRAAAVAGPLHAAIARIGPITLAAPTHASVAERLYVEVVNQQLSVRAALTIQGRIEAAALARGVAVRDLFVPGREAELRACGVSANKARALQAIRAADEAGELGPALAAMPHAERTRHLCRIRGVGPWTADMLGIFHFLDPDIWPAGDVAAVGSLKRLIGPADPSEVAARFAPERSLLARYAWRARDAAGSGQAT